MTQEEFANKVIKLIKELEEDEQWNIFIFMYDELGSLKSFGLGCPKCSIEIITNLDNDGDFQHTDNNRKTH